MSDLSDVPVFGRRVEAARTSSGRDAHVVVRNVSGKNCGCTNPTRVLPPQGRNRKGRSSRAARRERNEVLSSYLASQSEQLSKSSTQPKKTRVSRRGAHCFGGRLHGMASATEHVVERLSAGEFQRMRLRKRSRGHKDQLELASHARPAAGRGMFCCSSVARTWVRVLGTSSGAKARGRRIHNLESPQ
jgi:hypothetical protein